jgi:photosystem II stability/assembly factor-like uncharacterized protein
LHKKSYTELRNEPVEGWVIGRDPVETEFLFHTTDGGESWDKEVDEFFIPQDTQFVKDKSNKDAFKFLTTFGYIKSNQLLKRTPER